MNSNNKIKNAVEKLSLPEAAKRRIISHEVSRTKRATVTTNREKSAEVIVPRKREGMKNSNVK